jgi:hypothetical protein
MKQPPVHPSHLQPEQVHHYTYAEIAAELRRLDRENHHLYRTLARIIEALADHDPGTALMIAQLAHIDRPGFDRAGTQVVAPVTDAIVNRAKTGEIL